MKYISQTMPQFERSAAVMEVVLFGCGEYSMRFMNRIGELMSRVKYIVDNSKEKQDLKVYGIPVVLPDILKEMDAGKTLVVITAENNISEIYRQVLAYGDFPIMAARILLNDVCQTVAEELDQNRPLIRQVLHLLYDDTSRNIYRETIRRRMLFGECDFSDLIVKGDAEYRIPLLYRESGPKDEIVLDCGAYEGDTLKKFVNTYGPALKKIYLFECMEESLAKLERSVQYVRNGKFVPEMIVMPYALSDRDGKMTLAETIKPNGSFLVENRPFAKEALCESNYVEVAVSTIDRLVPEEEKVTFIKMDIEGSEYEALLGAKHTIRKHKPRLAISIYHSGKDYFRLPLLVKELVPEYQIAVRHHNKNHCDTDMYCWI